MRELDEVGLRVFEHVVAGIGVGSGGSNERVQDGALRRVIQ